VQTRKQNSISNGLVRSFIVQEELEENSTPTVYENYKFITRKELLRYDNSSEISCTMILYFDYITFDNSLGLDGQIGTNILRPYMHGFFIDLRLYEKV